METLIPPTIYAMLVQSANHGLDLPATLKRRFKDIPPGTMALLTLLRGADDQAAMIHVAWRTMAHGQPSDVLTVAEAEGFFKVV